MAQRRVRDSHPRTADVFSQIAPLWATRTDGQSRAEQAARRVVAALRPGGDVLDIGCGSGAHLALVREHAIRRGKAHGKLIGVDVAPAMVARADRRRGIRAVPGDATALPFGDQVFDVVLASRMLHFVRDPERAAREMVRVTQPGGTIVVELWSTGPSRSDVRELIECLPSWSLLRRYLELPRRYEVSSFRRMLEYLGCTIREAPVRRVDRSGDFLARLARVSGTPEDRDVVRDLRLYGLSRPAGAERLLIARLPGPRWGRMPITVTGLDGWTPRRVRRLIEDLPEARGYRLEVKPLHYRTRPHVQAFCEFEARRIIVQVPVPFRPFSEDVPYRAKRIRAKGLRFRWYRRRLRFDRPDELIRYLYLHEYYHWYLREVLGRPSAAETACDRFALQRL